MNLNNSNFNEEISKLNNPILIYLHFNECSDFPFEYNTLSLLERIKFEKQGLFPLAGLNPDEADLFYKVLDLQKNISYSGNEAARNFVDGKWTREQAVEWLMKNALRTKDSADKYVSFIEKYRSYVINYNLGMDIVKDYIERNGGTENNKGKPWELFEHLLSTPQTPSGLIK